MVVVDMSSGVIEVGDTGGGDGKSYRRQLDEWVMDEASSGATFDYYVLFFRV